MKVSICDGHRTFGEGLASLLATRGHSVVGCTVSISEVVEAARTAQPDVVLTELHVRDCQGHEVVGRIRSALPLLPLIVLTGDGDTAQLGAALRSGADGVVFKTEGVNALERVMSRVAVPRPRTDNGANARARVAWSPKARAVHERRAPTRPVGVTPRGRIVIELLALGKDTAAIAKSMDIAPATVRTHIQNLFEQLGVHSRGELIAAAVREGLVDPESTSSPSLDAARKGPGENGCADLRPVLTSASRAPLRVDGGSNAEFVPDAARGL